MGAAQEVVAFLQEALALLPAGYGLRMVRAEAGFFRGGTPGVSGATRTELYRGGPDDPGG